MTKEELHNVSKHAKTTLEFESADISGMSKAELEKRLKLYHAIVESQSDWISRFLPNFTLVFVNKPLAKMMQMRRDELIGNKLTNFLDEHNYKNLKETLEQITPENPYAVFEQKLTLPDGRKIWHQWVNHGFFDKEGHIIEYQGVGRDITNKKKREKEHRENEQKFKAIFNNVNDGILVADASTKNLKLANKKIAELLGYSKDEILSLSVSDLHPKEELAKVIDVFERQAKKEFLVAENIPMQRKDGSVFYADISSSPVKINERLYAVGIFRDNTERNKAEAKLQLTQVSIDSVKDCIFWIDENANFHFVNDTACRRLGYSREELLSMGVFEVDPIFPAEKWPEHWQKILKQGSLTIETVHRTKDGKEFPVEVTTSCVQHDGKQYNCAIARNISERKLAEQALRESEERFKQLSEASFEGVVFHENGVIITANKRYFEMFGYDESELIGKEALPLTVTPESLEIVRSKIQSGSIDPYEIVGLRKDGEEFPMSVMGRNVTYKDRNVRVAVVRDITLRKQAEEALEKSHVELEHRVEERTHELQKAHEQLRHSEKLAAIGKLSASIAHEFNNPLAGIQSVIEGVRRNSVLDEPYEKLMDMALSECDRVKKLIKNLQDFNRPSSGIKKTVDIHSLLNEILILVKKEYQTANITIIKQYVADLPDVQVVPDQMKQVFLNLLTNAKDAIVDDSGNVTITTENLNDKVAIRINDTGSGITPENLPHIFEPFFTTKSAVKGTGLGLSVSYGITQGHGGDILVDSVPCKGTTFSVILPFRENTNE